MFIFTSLDHQPVKISIVNYTNTLPFKWALQRSDLRKDIILFEDIPSICAQKLKFGQVDLALVPVALLPELNKYYIVTDYCIGADGIVDSVKLYSDVPLNEIRRVTLDYQSKSSITLTKVLFKFFWKLGVEYAEARPGFENEIKNDCAAVVIGDRTFGLNGKFKYEFDLADEWKKFTTLPFVFAAWVSTKELDPVFITRFNSALKTGVENISLAVEEDFVYQNLSREKTLEYLKEKIDYNLDEKKRQALRLFLDYIRKL